MKLGILSFRKPPKQFMWEEKRLQKEAVRMGHEVHLLRASRCMLEFESNNRLNVRYGKKQFPSMDLLIPRVSAEPNLNTRMAILKHLEFMGYSLLNSYQSILRAKSKLETLQILSHRQIPIVKTVVLNDVEYFDNALRYIGCFPIIMKGVYGSRGNFVTIAESRRAAKSMYGMLAKILTDTNAILIQEYIESGGKDLRLFVMGGKVLISMQRSAAEGDFRANVGQGGSGCPYTPTKEEERLAVRAVKALGLDYAGVDIIQTKHGPAIMEVNANAGFQELEETTGFNVAEAIIKYGGKITEKLRKL